ncbi:glycosyltransferase family 4 protein [Clostridium sp. YIM B02551]|uniref:glycosyltransferase family 4 protein n=1 Tax=Clostridium sp. YIM B02551 TaxID=2910679 RepID=UPI001EEBE0CA|nr:glycosyltransferase family 4 protein [Clostridium sp. YIM B02551]
MSILMIGPSRAGKGGIATVVNNYFQSDLINNIRIRYIATSIDSNKIFKLIYWIYSYLKIFIILFTGDIELVHIHMASRGSFYRKSKIVQLSKIFNKKIIIHLHGAQFDVFYNDECNDRKKASIRKVFDKADSVIVLSEQWRVFIKTLTKSRIDVLYNAVNVNEINEPNTSEKFYITFLGRLDKRKGVYDLIEAIKEVISENNSVTLNLAGDGEIDLVNKIIRDNYLQNNIKILGWINSEEKDVLLRKTSIYILPSYNEGMPMSILEAMSYGIPVISTYVGGIPSVIKNDINGILINPGDIKTLTLKIKELMFDKGKYTLISKMAHKTIIEKFSLKKHIETLMDIYDSILK